MTYIFNRKLNTQSQTIYLDCAPLEQVACRNAKFSSVNRYVSCVVNKYKQNVSPIPEVKVDKALWFLCCNEQCWTGKLQQSTTQRSCPILQHYFLPVWKRSYQNNQVLHTSLPSFVFSWKSRKHYLLLCITSADNYFTNMSHQKHTRKKYFIPHNLCSIWKSGRFWNTFSKFKSLWSKEWLCFWCWKNLWGAA